MDQNKQSRKWLLTLNNPKSHGYDRTKIIKLIELLTIQYGCLCYEIGENRTPHVHVYIYSKSPIKFKRLKSLIPEGHWDCVRGSSQENRDYITKSGKWENDKKAETNLRDTFYEIGSMPDERVSKEDKFEKLYEMIEQGLTTKEIIDEDKSYIYKLKQIEEIRQMMLNEKHREINRDIDVIYIWGDTGTGKTYGILKEHGSKNICRITSYRKGGNGIYFDSYNGEPVLVFEEFQSQIPIEDMLNFIDVYPLKLPCRYADKVACYSIVYLTSNLPLEDQYKWVQIERPKTWEAFLRRITKVIEYRSNGEIIVTDMRKGENKWNLKESGN